MHSCLSAVLIHPSEPNHLNPSLCAPLEMARVLTGVELPVLAATVTGVHADYLLPAWFLSQIRNLNDSQSPFFLSHLPLFLTVIRAARRREATRFLLLGLSGKGCPKSSLLSVRENAAPLLYMGVVQYSFTSKPPSRRAFRGPFAAQTKPAKKLHLRTIIAPMLKHIILPFRRRFRRAFADLSRPQKSIDFASHMFRLYIKCRQGF